MGETFEEYQIVILNEIRNEATVAQRLPSDYFFEDFALEKLNDMGEVEDAEIRPCKKRCSHNKYMGFDAYAFDDSDKSIILISNIYSDNIDVKLTKTDVDTFTTRMLNFLEEAYNDKLDLYFDETDDLLKVGQDIGRRMRIDYVKSEHDDSIDKIKLYIVTNRPLSERLTSYKLNDRHDKTVEVNIRSLERFYALYKSGRGKEPIRIVTSSYGLNKGIPCIKAEMSNNLDYDAYLAILPGDFLEKIYDDYGSRLLEGNVRAFLSNRGKINRGIRETIKKEPTKFFAYNNGIACTAQNIKLSSDGHYIEEIEDLQIINGGQTTASLYSAVKKDKLTVDNVFVPMKLTVVKDEDYDTMISNISKYANSQNRVKDSDLFSNHPFHRKFETLSKKIIAPAHGEYINDTYWYYERSRGMYEQEIFRIQKQSDKEAFKRKYPKKQVVKKEDLAKFYTAGKLLRPDIVSKGSEKCMSQFAEYIDKLYTSNEAAINEQFYKECICYAILYKATDQIVLKASWYNTGGYKLNIVPYTLSKLIASLPNDYCLDFDLIWRKQEIYPSLAREIDKIAQKTNQFIQDSNGVIVTEYCKKEETWIRYKNEPYSISDELQNTLIRRSFYEEKVKSNEREQKRESNLNIELEIVKLGGPYWRGLIEEGTKRGLLNQQELDLLNIAASIDTSKPKIATQRQAKAIWQIRKKLEEAGVLV